MGYAVWKKGNGSDNTLYYVYTDDSRASAITMAHKLFEVYDAVVVMAVDSNKPVLIMQR